MEFLEQFLVWAGSFDPFFFRTQHRNAKDSDARDNADGRNFLSWDDAPSEELGCQHRGVFAEDTTISSSRGKRRCQWCIFVGTLVSPPSDVWTHVISWSTVCMANPVACECRYTNSDPSFWPYLFALVWVKGQGGRVCLSTERVRLRKN